MYVFPRKLRLTEFARVMLWVARKAGMLSPAGDPGSMAFPQNHAICCLDSGVHTPVRSQFSVCLFEQALGKQVPTCWILVLSGSFPKAAAGAFCGFQNILFFKIGYCLNVCTYVETSGICSSLLLIKLPHKHKILTLAHPFPGSCCLYSSLMSSCIVAPPSGRRKYSRKQSASTSLLPKPQGLQW